MMTKMKLLLLANIKLFWVKLRQLSNKLVQKPAQPIVNKPRLARSLTTTLAIAFFAMSAVILMVNGSLALFTNIQSNQNAISSKQQLIAQDAAKTVSKFIQDKFGALETAVELANPVNVSAETQKTFMDNLLGHDPAFRQFALFDSQGQQLAQSSRASQTLSSQFNVQLKGDVLSLTSTGQRYISPIYIDDASSEPLITIAIPVKNVFGDFQGSLVTEVNLKFMWQVVDQLKVGETGYAYVVDKQGNLIAFGDTSRVLRGENLQQIVEVKEFIQNPSASTDSTPEVANYTGLLGKTVVGTYVPLGTPEWAVVIELPTAEANQPVIGFIRGYIISTLVLAGLAGLIGVFVARRLAAPLVNLTETATRIADGERGLQAAPSGPQEIVSLATAFNSMTAQLRGLIGSLEERVAARTKDLATVAQVGTATASIMETDKLLQTVVDLTKDRFSLYHSHIYLLDEAGQNLVLASGAGEPGRQMKANGLSIPLNREQSLVARAARERKGITVYDVTQAPDFLPNPLLPDTRSELAVPILVGENMIGVFDVQSVQVGRFTDSDINIQTTLAAQVGASIQNARSYEQSKSRAELESLVNAIGQKIQRATTVDDTLQTAIREIGLALGASRVSANIGISRQHDGNEASRN